MAFSGLGTVGKRQPGRPSPRGSRMRVESRSLAGTIMTLSTPSRGQRLRAERAAAAAALPEGLQRRSALGDRVRGLTRFAGTGREHHFAHDHVVVVSCENVAALAIRTRVVCWMCSMRIPAA
jgi:hypothetical protein